MLIREIQEFQKIRKDARAYFCYLLQRNLPNRLPNIGIDVIYEGLERIVHEIPGANAAYILDAGGKQISKMITVKEKYKNFQVEFNQANRTYFYKAVKEKKCILTDPYPSLIGGDMVVSAAMPIFNDKGELLYVAVIDLPLDEILKFVHQERGDTWAHNFNRVVYGIFAGALFAICVLLFIDGIKMFFTYTINNIDVKKMFESTILITLSLALFDLVKTLLFEEVIGEKEDHPFAIHKTMIKFLGSIVIALAIEGLMLVFKFAMIAPQKLMYAAMLLAAVTFLLIGLAYYMKNVGKDIK
ncbi:putative general glycosylation pathway protein PglG [Nautilia profundicola AmH]|uniref:General glycosylation pathway protein PglG n=1 Tax=Nautilia profundicola (strain ATCC BAA-1463 / DSM 18972 / AmH) TaxID=598659 RepID=B9L7G0_NAUPA|nr:PDC sensor domain-containing protein [Nautilia profundicola]ACM92583.1 putative general glycosylation pathway protein PglG [Nautilia profundicola AmH]